MTTSPTPTVASVEATVEQHLHRFYVELQAWIDGGAVSNHIFDRRESICYCLANWACVEDEDFDVLHAEIRRGFAGAGLHTTYPFNNGMEGDWAKDRFPYTNPSRLAWIKAHAQPIGGENA